jgi:carbon storage regulator CsrA
MTKHKTTPRMAQPTPLEAIEPVGDDTTGLVLSRKLNECIHIGRGITVKIVDISRNKVRILISAPRSLPIVRGELKPKEEPRKAG